jgi:hypothetical protein
MPELPDVEAFRRHLVATSLHRRHGFASTGRVGAPAPAKFMGFVGLVPSEYSTGASTHRSAINMEPKYTESDTFATDYWASSAILASFFGATRM